MIRSHWTRPASVFFHWKKPTVTAISTGSRMYQYPVTRFEAPTVILVSSGRVASSPGVSAAISSKTPAKTGTMKATTASITTSASANTKLGYSIAARIWRLRASSFSRWKATRSSTSSSLPEPSPERTIERNSWSNTFGWRSIASATELPASTSLRRPTIASFSLSSSVWSSSV